MAFYTGTIAKIKLGSSSSPTDVLGQCTSYSLEKTVENVDVSSIGSTFKQFSKQSSTSSAVFSFFFHCSITHPTQQQKKGKFF